MTIPERRIYKLYRRVNSTAYKISKGQKRITDQEIRASIMPYRIENNHYLVIDDRIGQLWEKKFVRYDPSSGEIINEQGQKITHFGNVRPLTKSEIAAIKTKVKNEWDKRFPGRKEERERRRKEQQQRSWQDEQNYRRRYIQSQRVQKNPYLTPGAMAILIAMGLDKW